jgi:hypothetical protein
LQQLPDFLEISLGFELSRQRQKHFGIAPLDIKAINLRQQIALSLLK